MALKQYINNRSLLLGIAGFSAVAATILLLPRYLKPDPDAGVTYYATEGCVPFEGECVGRSGDQSITLELGRETIESMTKIPIRVRLGNMTVDSLIVDFEGLHMYMGIVRTRLLPDDKGVYQGTITLPECGTGKMLWRARAILEHGMSKEGIKFDFWAV